MAYIKRNLEKIKHPPLLYIIQSQIPDVSVSMQNEIKSKPIKKSIPKPVLGNAEENKKSPLKKDARNFNKWSNKEKVFYFIELPEEQKKNICLIKTKETEVIGRIMSHDEGVVEVFVPMKRAHEKLLIKDIIRIEVIGV